MIQLFLGTAALAILMANASAGQQTLSGEQLFKQRCAMCHTNAPAARNGVGPNLYGMEERKAGAIVGYDYSAALKGSKLVWTKANLDAFLAAPNRLVPGTRMVLNVPDPKQRAALTAFLLSKQ